MEMSNHLTLWIGLWLASAFLIIFVRWRRKVAGSGLVFAYFFNLMVIHWAAAFLYILPWYSSDYLIIWYRGFDPKWVMDGFRLSTYGIVAFTFGSLVVAPLLVHVIPGLRQRPAHYIPDPRLPRAYVTTGLLGYFAFSPFFGRIPTVSTLLSSGLTVTALGIALALWNVWTQKKHRKFLGYLMIALPSLPLLTLITQGFVSFGAVALTGVIAFVADFYRPRWRLIAMALLTSYLGLSFYVTYMRDRDLIREVVWGGESLLKRVDRLHLSLRTLEWFNLHDDNHLRLVDQRLNQNLFVGAAVEELSYTQAYARGETVLETFVSLVPRIVWPEKPLFVGGARLVSRFTGMQFYGPTTMAVGQVLEFYINFGVRGVVVGFLCLGVIITLVDSVARDHLLSGDWQGFAFWFLSGMGFLRVEGTLVEIVATIAAGVLTIFFVNRFLKRFHGRKILWQKRWEGGP
jgi:hypothetical protein